MSKEYYNSKKLDRPLTRQNGEQVAESIRLRAEAPSIVRRVFLRHPGLIRWPSTEERLRVIGRTPAEAAAGR